jgi:hypothetical protein
MDVQFRTVFRGTPYGTLKVTVPYSVGPLDEIQVASATLESTCVSWFLLLLNLYNSHSLPTVYTYTCVSLSFLVLDVMSLSKNLQLKHNFSEEILVLTFAVTLLMK